MLQINKGAHWGDLESEEEAESEEEEEEEEAEEPDEAVRHLLHLRVMHTQVSLTALLDVPLGTWGSLSPCAAVSCGCAGTGCRHRKRHC